MEDASVSVETILSTLAHLFAEEGKAREVAIIAHAKAQLPLTNHYEDFGVRHYAYSLIIEIPQHLYAKIVSNLEQHESQIKEKSTPLFRGSEYREYLESVVIKPQPPSDTEWRDKAKAWLAGSGVNNQGRVRSDNIASRVRDGLLFRSEPEILLYRALKSLGVSFAPLAVFVRGGQNYSRIEPDFTIIKDGMVMVVEVDGDTVHHETPAEAHDRTTMLVHEGAHVERIKASQCNTLEKASQCANHLIEVFAKLKRAGR